MSSRVTIGPIAFDCLGMEELIARLMSGMEQGSRYRIAFANPEFVMSALKDGELRTYLAGCRFVLADGVGILLASRLIHSRRLPERVAGSDFVPKFVAALAEKSKSIFLFGAEPGIAERAARELKEIVPRCKVAGTRSGYFSEEEETAIVEDINRAQPDVLMVCLGCPKQERWIQRNFDKVTSCKIVFGNGGSIDFLSQHRRRAPLFIQGLGLEWLFRLFQDPSVSRIKRQARLLMFLGFVCAWAIRGRFSGRV